MVDTPRMSQKHRKYIEAKLWKCLISPTGAHHWIETSPPGTYKCKWCHKEREFPRTYNEATKWVERLAILPNEMLEENDGHQ